MTDRIAFAGKVEATGRRLRGEVILAGARTFRNGEWLEVDPAALVKADAKGIFASWEHDDNKLLAASTNNTLRVTRTETGFTYETEDLPNVTYANDALELVRGGYVTGTSFEIEGNRSTFSTDPDGTRVRRITSIKRFRAVNPVRDPAFVNSTVAAFSQEKEDMSNPAETAATEPVITTGAPNTAAAPVTPKIEAKPDPKDSFSDEYKTAEAFARTRDLKDLEAAMDNVLAGGIDSPSAADTYRAFAKVYDERKAFDAEARQRAEGIQLAHLLRTGRGPKAPQSRELYESDDYAQAFSAYLRDGRASHMEQFAQSIAGDGTQGGFTVPDGFLQRITQRLKAFGGIAGVADEITTSTGESLRWPYLDDTSNTAAIASEGSAPASGGADLVFDSIELGAFSYASTGASNSPLKVSLELIQDSAFDITALVSDKLGERIGRKQAVDLANGAGGTAPVGLFTKSADTMTATVASLAAPEHIFQVDSAYRDGGNCRFIMSDTTLVKFWQAQTTTNEPLFIPGGSSIGGAPHGTIYGFPVTIDPAAGNNVSFGDHRAGYIIRRVRGVQVLVDPYTAQSTRQVAYHAWARMDANIQDPNAYSVSSYSGVSADT